MKFHRNPINRKSGFSVLLALLLLALSATPTLAWFDEGDVAGQASRPCRVIEDGVGGHTVYCAKTSHHFSPVVVEAEPRVRPAIVRAENITIFVPQSELAQR
jgi:hypothetical protein